MTWTLKNLTSLVFKQAEIKSKDRFKHKIKFYFLFAWKPNESNGKIRHKATALKSLKMPINF